MERGKLKKMTKYLTIRQACQALQVCRNTLKLMIADGRVKAVDIRRPGGKYAVWRISAISHRVLHRLSVEEQIKLREIERRMGGL